MSKGSIFSDLNNLEVVTITSGKYKDAFGFMEDEVIGALKEFGLSDKLDKVEYWYDGFRFGSRKEGIIFQVYVMHKFQNRPLEGVF